MAFHIWMQLFSISHPKNTKKHKAILKLGEKSKLFLSIIVVLIVDFILFGSLLLHKNIIQQDFQSIPGFIKLSPLQILAGFSYTAFDPFKSVDNPGFNLLFLSFIYLFHGYAENVLAYINLVLYSMGILYFLTRFSTPTKALIGSLIAVMSPALPGLLLDSPFALYIAPIPFFLGFYYDYRILNKSLLRLLVGGIILSFTSIYGPTIVTIFIFLISIELSEIFTRRNYDLVKGFTATSFTIILFILFHISPLIDRGAYISSYGKLGAPIPKYNIVQILSFHAMYAPENFFYTVLTLNTAIIISSFFIALFIFFIIIQTLHKDLFSLLLILFIMAVLSYQSNYLFLFQIFSNSFSIFNHVDPIEYNPLLSLWLGIAVARFPESIFKSIYESKMNGIEIRKLHSFTHKSRMQLSERCRSKERMVYLVVLSILISLSIFSGLVTAQSLWGSWVNIRIPEFIKNVYNVTSSANGVTIFIPTTAIIDFNYLQRSFDVIGTKNTVTAIPSMIFYVWPPSWVGPPEFQGLDPYSRLYSALEAENQSLFLSLSKKLDIEYIVYFPPSVLNKGFGAWGLPYFGGFYLPNVSEVEVATGFRLFLNISGQAYILKNPNYIDCFKMYWRGIALYISVNKTVKNISLPLYSYYPVIADGANVFINSEGQLFLININNNPVKLTSPVIEINLFEQFIVIFYWIIVFLFFIRMKLKNVSDFMIKKKY